MLAAVRGLGLAAAILMSLVPVSVGIDRMGGGGPEIGSKIVATSPAAGLFEVTGLAPGSVAVTSMSFRNEGVVAGSARLTCTLDQLTPSETTLARYLTLKLVDDASGDVVFDGALGGAADVALGRFGPGRTRTYRVEIGLAPSAPDSTQGVEQRIPLTWTVSDASRSSG